jgi:fatty-acyl-CoA synthase
MDITKRVETLPLALENAARSQRGACCLDDNGEEHFYSWDVIFQSALRVAGALKTLGLRPGDRVAVILPKSEEFMAGFFGASLAGFVPVPMYPPLNMTQLEAYLTHSAHIAKASMARVALTSAELQPLLQPLQLECPDLTAITSITDALSGPTATPVLVQPHDPAFIQFTSGSTSRPKGVVLTHENLRANILAFCGPTAMQARRGVDTGVSWLPLFHDMGLIGMLMGAIYHESSVAILPPALFLRRPVTWLKAISRHKATVSFGTNFAYGLCAKRIRDADLVGLDLSSWRIAGCGAEPIQCEALQQFATRFASIGFDERAFLPAYGMAEHTLALSMPPVGRGVVVDCVERTTLSKQQRAVACSSDDADVQRFVGCGRAFPGHSVRIVDERDQPLADRTVGEVVARGPSVMSGYHTEAATKTTIRDGWLHTGDLGYMVDGELFICGRKKELIIINGRNCYPQDIEWMVGEVDGVRKGSVVAFGTSANGSRERLVVVAERRGALNAGELKERILRSTQGVPGLTLDEVIVVPSGTIPKTSSGKLQRARTKTRYEQGTLLKPVENKAAAVKKAQSVAVSRAVRTHDAERPGVSAAAV